MKNRSRNIITGVIGALFISGKVNNNSNRNIIIESDKNGESKNFNYFDFIRKMNSFSTFFIQNYYDKNDKLFDTKTGSLIYKKKSRFFLKYEESIIISNGQSITYYEKDLQQVTILKNDTNYINIDNFFNESLINAKFRLEIFWENDENHINLSPIDKDTKNSDYLMVVKDNVIKSITFMNELDQSVVEFIFTDFKINVIVQDSQFKIDIPQDWAIITVNE